MMTGSVLVKAMVTTKERSRMASSISAVAMVCIRAPTAAQPMARRSGVGMGTPMTSRSTSRNSRAKGIPNRKRT